MNNFIKFMPGFRSSILRKLILYILILSTIITIIGTCWRLYRDYMNEKNSIHLEISQIEETYQQSITNSLWITDYELLQIQLEGILKIPDIQFIEIRLFDKQENKRFLWFRQQEQVGCRHGG